MAFEFYLKKPSIDLSPRYDYAPRSSETQVNCKITKLVVYSRCLGSTHEQNSNARCMIQYLFGHATFYFIVFIGCN
ncbi:hypothetical protein LguiA_018393 [Lonicera macranthoides]